MVSAQQFIQDFHSLEGVTLGERIHNFNKLLKLNSSLPEAEITLISKNLNPQTYLESLFKIDALIAFKRTPELLEVLKEGNDVFVSKIVKNPWFMQEAFGKIGAEDLVNSVLPNTSFSARMKILARFSSCLEENQIDEIFNCVKERYGLFIALKILHRCSPKKIEEIIATNFTVDFSAKKLKVLFLKDPKLIEIYFTDCKKKLDNGFLDYNCFHRFKKTFIPFLFKMDPHFCMELCTKFQIALKVGRRSTKTYVDLKKDQILENPKEYKNNLKLNPLFRYLSRENAIKFIVNHLEPSMNISYWTYEHDILKSLPKKLRYDLFSAGIEVKFKTTILNNPSLISKTLLDSLNIKDKIELRNDLARAKLKADATEDDFIKYLPVDESIPLLKEKLRSSSSIKDRRKFLLIMMETCIEKDDMAALTEVIKYFYERHRNDREEIHRDIMWKLDEAVDKTKFTEELWMLHKKLKNIRLVKFGSSTRNDVEISYVEYLFKEKKLSEEDLFKSIRANAWDDPIFFYDKVSSNNHEFKKYLLHLFLEKGESVIKGDVLDFYRKLIKIIVDYNEEHKNDPIVEIENHPRLMKYFIDNMEKKDNLQDFRKYFKKIMFGEIQVKDKDFYVRYFIKKYHAISSRNDRELISWFLKFTPLIVSEEMDSILNLTLNKECISLMKKYSHLKLDEKMIEAMMKSFDKNGPKDNAKYKIENVKLLTEIMYPVERFIEFANEYKPTEPQFDAATENKIKLFKMRCEIAKGFKNFTGNHKIVLPALLNYCIGDYFGSALGSLRRILRHTPENQVSPIIEQLSQNYIAIRKHALSITCEIGDVVSAQNQLKLLEPGQDRVTKRRVMKSILGFFRKNPSDPLYELVKPKIRQLYVREDSASFGAMTNIKRIPKKYQSEYIEFVWNLPKEEDNNEYLNELHQELLDNLYEDAIKALPMDFCLKLINENLFKGLKFRDFVSNLLVYHPEKLKILQTVLLLLEGKKESNQFFVYFSLLYQRFINEKDLDHEFLETFSKYWDDRIKPELHFDNYIRLQFFKLKAKHGDHLKVADFNDLVRKLLDDFISKYGQYILYPLTELLDKGVKFFAYKIGVDSIKFYDDLMQRHKSVEAAISVMQMLPSDMPNKNDEDKFSAFKSLMEGLQAVPDPGVQIIFKRKYWNCIKDLE